ncbi:MAG: tRNA (adenosine(37)-N6)-threonylcarbamoyltransferase complex ATPase subunit type 1 TsaE [Clostridia bacterium]
MRLDQAPLNLISHSVEETMQMGEDLALQLKAGDVVALNGDLGAGKTAFAAGIAKGLGVTDYVTSPTFAIMNILEGRLPFHHFDVYRITDPDEMEEIGLNEFLYGEGVCVIEWADRIEDLLPARYIDVRMSRIDETERRLTIENISR